MKPSRLHVTAFVLIAAFLWALALWVENIPITWALLRPFSMIVSSLVVLALAWDIVLWRHAWLHGWFVKRPDLRGSWRVELQSSYVNPETHLRVPLIVCYMSVKQTFSSLQMHLMTPESESWFIADHIRLSPNGVGFQIIGVYTNEPNVHLRHKRISEMHQGAIIIESHGPTLRPSTLTAKYWTDRQTTGTMDFNMRVEDVYTRFSDAEEGLKNSGGNRVNPH